MPNSLAQSPAPEPLVDSPSARLELATSAADGVSSYAPVARKHLARRRVTAADVRALNAWLETLPLGVRAVCCIRTSDVSSKNFAAMFDLGTRMRSDDQDFAKLREIGVELVQRGGEELRREWDVFELRRGSVPGGHGRALLGYCVVIGHTLFILYMETARKADIPGTTVDQTRNAFTEALVTILRTLRPGVLYTPLVSRVFRNMDFASQVMRTLRDLHIRLHAEGQDVPLQGDEGITGLLKSWFSAREADAIVSRLDSIEKNIYADGDWYLGENFLPFTWRLKSRTEVDPLTGESRRVVVSKRDLEVVPGSAEVLRWFIREGARRGVTNHDLGIGLGQRGVRSRAPQHAPNYPTLDKLNNPANGAATLMAEKWRAAWRTGIYRRSVRLKADHRLALPELTDRISEVENEDGSVTLFLDVETRMPAPDGGWGLTDKEWDDFVAIRFEPTPQRLGRAASSAGNIRPLASLCSYLDDEVYWELSCRSSGPQYHLLRVPRSEAVDASGHVLVVPKAWPAAASLACPDLHRSVSKAIIEALKGLGDRVVSLRRGLEPMAADTPEQRRAKRIAEAESAVARLQDQLRGIRVNDQELAGRSDLSDEERSERRAELRQDEEDARAKLRAARAAVKRAQEPLTETQPTTSQAVTAEADLADLHVVAAALARTTHTAPNALNQVLARVLRDFRIWTVARGAAVQWSARLLVPLKDGTWAEIDISCEAPLRSVLSTRRLADVPERSTANASSPQLLGTLFFEDGMSLQEIGDLRGIDGSGYNKSLLVRRLVEHLNALGVVNGHRAMAALDMPRSQRARLHRGLTNKWGEEPDYEAALARVYRSSLPWQGVWCMSDHHRPVRRIINVLAAGNALFEGLPAHLVADTAGIAYDDMLDLTRPRNLLRGIRSAPLGKNFTRQTSSGADRRVFALPCPHQDCLSLVESGAQGLLVPLLVPETSTPLHGDEQVTTGLICSSCRRTPDEPRIVHPRDLLLPWIGGRRQKQSVDGRTTYVGSRLDSIAVKTLR